MITRTGYIIPKKTVPKELYVKPIATEYGPPPQTFKLFKTMGDYACIPQFYGVEKFSSDCVDKRPDPARMSSHVKFEGKLRHETHQIEAHNKAVQQGNGIIVLPCGYGKTTVALAVACTLGLRTMIVVHKEFLANQWRDRIRQFCPNASIGLVQRDVVDVEADFVIAMLQSLSQKSYPVQQFESVGTVFVDEAHHICSRVFSQSMFKMCPRHPYGLSATPDRKDGLTMVLEWFVGSTVFEVARTNQQQVTVEHVPWFEDFPDIPRTRFGKPCLATMITLLCEIPTRNDMIIKLVTRLQRAGRQTLLLSDRRSHCKLLHEALPKSGLYIGGMTEEDLRRSSECPIVIGTYSQAHEGLDIPTLDSLILCTPKTDITQSVGRILRETPGKLHAPYIVDIRDSWGMLASMGRKRDVVYRTGGFNILGEVVKSEFKGKCFL